MHMQTRIEQVPRWTLRPRDRVNSEIHMDAVIGWVGDRHGGHDWSQLEDNLKVVDLEAIDLEAIDLKVVNLEAVNLEAVNLGAATLEAFNQEEVDKEAWVMEAETLLIG